MQEYRKKKITYDLSVIILNYKKPQLTLKCVNLLLKSLKGLNIISEIIIVDNSSIDSDNFFEEHLSFSKNNITLIKNKKNLGFARANNQGLKIAKGKYLLILNNDVFIKNGLVISEGIHYLKKHLDVGLWSPALVGKDDIIQKTTGKFPSIKRLIEEYYFFNIFEKNKFFSALSNVDTVVGAFWLIPMSTIKNVGLLDEDYFFTSEDVDYCKRIHDKCLSVIYDPTLHVIHLGGASQNWNWLNDPYLHKGRKLYFKKNKNYITFIVAEIIIDVGLFYRRLISHIRHH